MSKCVLISYNVRVNVGEILSVWVMFALGLNETFISIRLQDLKQLIYF